MSRPHFTALSGPVNFRRSVPYRPEIRTYGLGLSDLVFAEEMTLLRTVFRRGTFGRCETIERWIDECIHPGYRDEALELVAKMRANP